MVKYQGCNKMTNGCNGKAPEFILSIAKKLKPLSTADDLVVELGVANSTKTLANKRFSGTGPDFIRISGTGVRYPDEAVVRWLIESCVYVAGIKRA